MEYSVLTELALSAIHIRSNPTCCSPTEHSVLRSFVELNFFQVQARTLGVVLGLDDSRVMYSIMSKIPIFVH